MRKWLLLGSLAAVVALTVGATFAVVGSPFDDDGGQPAARSDDSIDPQECSLVHNREACDDSGQEPGSAAMCIEGVPDCDDAIVVPDGGAAGEDPDEPVSSGPITSGDDVAPDECSFVHNIDACQKQAEQLAIEDLSARLGSPRAIVVKGSGFVEWPDSCLGISGPDVVCAQVITPGFKIVLGFEGSDQTFEYHTDGGSVALLAE